MCAAFVLGGGLWLLALAARANLPPIDMGDTNITVLRTGGINPLITRYWDLAQGTYPVAPWLTFSFAFETEEIPRDAQVFDSATFFIQDLNSLKASMVATVDGNGVVWLPPTTETIPIRIGEFETEPRDFPSFQPVFAIQTSYSVTFRIPQSYYPEPIRFVFQMFDYPNGLNSVAMVTPPQLILVPEPATLSIGLLALGLLRFRKQVFPA